MNLALYLIITALLIVLAILITIFLLRHRYQARLLEAGEKSRLLEDVSGKSLALEAELREMLGFKSLAQERADDLDRMRATLSGLQVELTSAVAENKGLKTQLDQQQTVLEGTFKKMEGDFQVLSQRMLEESAKKLDEHSKESLKTVLDPLTRDLGEFKKRIDATHDEETKQRSSLQEQVRILAEMNQKISKDTENLTKALKGETKTQGTWGEMILQKLLEVTGLREGEEYELQLSFAGPDGKRLQPDVVVHLPEERDVVVDAKVSLVAFDAFVRAENDDDRAAAASALVASIRAHMKGLSSKAYQNLEGINSIDYVVMFVANEGALSVAMMTDRALLEDAVRQNIMLSSPTSLLAILRGIEFGWRAERQNQRVQEVFKLAGDLYDKFVGFAADIEDLGRRLDQVHQSYDAAKGKLVSGRGNLTGRIGKLLELGAKNTKSLPIQFLRNEPDLPEIENSPYDRQYRTLSTHRRPGRSTPSLCVRRSGYGSRSHGTGLRAGFGPRRFRRTL
jgi:DNA recombination protein RmuC